MATRIRTRRRAERQYEMDVPELLELTLGPKPGPSAFDDRATRRAAWMANREELVERFARHTHSAAWRPDGFWVLDAGRPDLLPTDAEIAGESRGHHDARLTWLVEHDAFLPGEVEDMRRHAEADRRKRVARERREGWEPGELEPSYAERAWAVVGPLVTS